MKWFTIVRRNKRKNQENDTSLTQLLRHAVQISSVARLAEQYGLPRSVWN